MFENLVHSAENNNVRWTILAYLFARTRLQNKLPLPRVALIAVVLSGSNLISCASAKTSKEVMEERNSSARPRSAAYAADNFYLDNRNPADRETRGWDFFYKHCKLMGRENTAPNKADWDCTDPK